MRELTAGAALDLALGDPRSLPHPVRGIGFLASAAEPCWRAAPLPLRAAGAGFWLTVVGATAAVVRITTPWASVYWIYALLACRDLDVEAARVIAALNAGDIEEARRMLARIVGRDTAELDEPEIVRATIETVAENLSDGVIAPLFWLLVAGPVGMAVYKAANTLDSMVGYRNERYAEFGWASARMDDALNAFPARLTAALITVAALLPGFSATRALRAALRDGSAQPSPNAGYPEAAFAGALGVQLGGLNFYQGRESRKPLLGDPVRPLNTGVFPRARVLLYTCEALFVGIAAGVIRWRR